MQTERKTVVVAGATGFIGKALLGVLSQHFEVIGLSRGARTSPHATMRQVDLLDASATREALKGADLAVYLVHSMMPSERLVQGDFADIDLMVADNFARAARDNGVRRIVYLGGLVPQGGPKSDHLRSRVEVEDALGAYGVPVTTLRAGLVFGPGGSSSRIVFNLARRLPVMVLPKWTEVATQPVALEDAVLLLQYVLQHPHTTGQTYDIGAPDVVSYRQMMALVGEAVLGRKPWMVGVPVLTPKLSRLWVSLVTGAPKELVAPLVESLSHPMVCADRRLQEEAGLSGRPIAETLPEAVRKDRDAGKPLAFEGRAGGEPLVRSVQRFAAPGARAGEVADQYFTWLDHIGLGVVRVTQEGATMHIGVRFWPRPLLSLEKIEQDADRVVYRIIGGELVAPEPGATFEFREVLGGRAVLVSIAGYRPRLPWWLYRVTQAEAHRLVMALFARVLGSGGIGAMPAVARHA
jgi:uncharacterized protein YbjT (DUF2867 family)